MTRGWAEVIDRNEEEKNAPTGCECRKSPLLNEMSNRSQASMSIQCLASVAVYAGRQCVPAECGKTSILLLPLSLISIRRYYANPSYHIYTHTFTTFAVVGVVIVCCWLYSFYFVLHAVNMKIYANQIIYNEQLEFENFRKMSNKCAMFHNEIEHSDWMKRRCKSIKMNMFISILFTHLHSECVFLHTHTI